jgi:probable rRNA maturation factor
LKIHISNSQKSLPISKASARLLVRSVLEFLDSSPEEVSIYFVSTKRISRLHDQFFQDPTTTDCISFPIDEAHLGEVFVCPETALNYGKKKKIDPYDECALYVIHALLHCLGYDDLEPAKKRTMRKMEKRCMGLIKKLNISLRP